MKHPRSPSLSPSSAVEKHPLQQTPSSMAPPNDPSSLLPPEASRPNKRRRVDTLSAKAPAATPSKHTIPWRYDSQRRIYSSKLFDALSRARNTAIASSQEDLAATPGEVGVLGLVRGIADRVLATAAKGRTRWSRAILANRVRVTAPGKRRHQKVRSAASACAGGNRLRKGRRLLLPAVEKRVKVLGRLVPGCRGISVTSLLEETTDYIAALEMQVKAMTSLSQLLGAPAVRSSSLAPAPAPAQAPADDDSDDVSASSARC